jgi:hypothetical protein
MQVNFLIRAVPRVLLIAALAPLSACGAPGIRLPVETSLMAVSPSALSMNGTGSGNALTMTITDPGYIGPITAVNSNPKAVSLNTSRGKGPKFSIVVTPLAFGTASIVVSDAAGGRAVISASVTSTTFQIQ